MKECKLFILESGEGAKSSDKAEQTWGCCAEFTLWIWRFGIVIKRDG